MSENPLYSGWGAGVRIRNEKMVFNTIQLGWRIIRLRLRVGRDGCFRFQARQANGQKLLCQSSFSFEIAIISLRTIKVLCCFLYIRN